MDIETELEINPKKPSEVVCTFCRKPACEDFANIHQKSDLLDLLKKLGVDITPIKGKTDWICYQCTYKLNCIRDYARTWASCVTNSRLNYYYKLGKKEMVRRLLNLNKGKPKSSLSIDTVVSPNNGLNSSHNQNELKLKISSVRTIRANDIPKTLTATKTTAQNNEDINNSDRCIGTPEPNLLSVMYEQSESVLVTESGGKINEYRQRNKINRNTSSLKCKTCYRVYSRLSFLNKHERKHEQNFLDANMINRGPNTIRCSYCDIVFTSLASWRTHYKIHQSHMKCSYCPAEFILRADFEMHEAMCYGMLCARDESQQTTRYNTRSTRRTNDVDFENQSTLSEPDSNYTERLENVRDWVNNSEKQNGYNEGTSEKNGDYDDNDQSCVTSFTRASSRISKSFLNAVEGDSSRSKEPSNKSNPHISYKLIKNIESSHENTIKRRKHNNFNNTLDKNVELIKCPDEECNFVSTSLLRLQEHDLTVHDVLPLFPCKSCHGQFLRRCYLEHHLEGQNHGLFVCNKCEKIFNFEMELKDHFREHNLAQDEETSHKCAYCNLTFLEEHDLQTHLTTPRHFIKKSARKTIFLIKTTNPPVRPLNCTHGIFFKEISLNETSSSTTTVVKPYKSEIRIRKFLKPLKRRNEIVFRRWKPGKDPQCLNGFEFPNCAAKQYKNLDSFFN